MSYTRPWMPFPDQLAQLQVRGMDIVIVTTARTDDEGAELLRGLGCPLRAQ